MPSEVDISNLALSHLGDSATVASLDPPEGSAQAEHCARFYPISRDALLEMHSWGFATKRVSLPQLNNLWPEWKYAYQAPNDCVNTLAVMPPGATDDYSVGIRLSDTPFGAVNTGIGLYTPQEYAVETDDAGESIILTNQENAVLRYTARVVDTTKFSPLFTISLGWLLAGDLAGPVLKGDAGEAASVRCLKAFQLWFAKATVSDANQQRKVVQQSVSWMAGR